MWLRPSNGQLSGDGKSTFFRKQFSWDIFAPGQDKFDRISSFSAPQPWFYPYINTFRPHNNANEYFYPRFMDEKTGAQCGLVACLKVTPPVSASQDPNTDSGAPGSALLATSLYIYGLKWEKGDGDPWQETSSILEFYFNSTNNWEISTARQWFRHQTQNSHALLWSKGHGHLQRAMLRDRKEPVL